MKLEIWGQEGLIGTVEGGDGVSYTYSYSGSDEKVSEFLSTVDAINPEIVTGNGVDDEISESYSDDPALRKVVHVYQNVDHFPTVWDVDIV